MTPAERSRLIDQYAQGPARLRAALATVPAEALTWRPAPGEWSAHEVVVHCSDSETASYGRVRMLLTDPEPVIVGYDQDRWARDLDYHAQSIELALATVTAVRASTVPLLRGLPESAWGRSGRHSESGAYGMVDWLRIYADHLEGHSRQIDANVQAWTLKRGGTSR